MSMSEEQLQKTGILHMMLAKDEEEELTLRERIDFFEDKLDYINIDTKKKNKLKELADKIKSEDDEKVQEFLFKQLVKILDEEQLFYM